MQSYRSHLRPAVLAGILATLLIGTIGCATTASDVHGWGQKRQTHRIYAELRGGKASDEVRMAAAEVLGRANEPAAIPELVKLSRDPSARVRLHAVRGLGQYNGREAYAGILRATGDDDIEVSRAARSILVTWSDDSIDAVLEALDDGNYRVRSSAVQTVWRMNYPRAGDTLCRRARLDESAVVRREAVRAIGQMGFEGCRDLLHTLRVSDASADVKMEAESALARLGKNVSKVKVVVLPMAELPATIDPSLATRLSNEIKRQIREARICEVLREPGEPIRDPLREAERVSKLTSADQIVYATAMHEGNRVRVKVFRIDARGKLLQAEESVNLDTRLDAVVRSVAGLLVDRFTH